MNNVIVIIILSCFGYIDCFYISFLQFNILILGCVSSIVKNEKKDAIY